jgi:WD40 repeat protein/tetratricopeptide (TPR) repeat protein
VVRANEPCPCGSGKKYKKCCGAKESPAGSSPRSRPPFPAPNGQPSTRAPSRQRPVGEPRGSPPSRVPDAKGTVPAPGEQHPTQAPQGPKEPGSELTGLARWLGREAGFLQHHPYFLTSHVHNSLHLEGGSEALISRAGQTLAQRPWAQLANEPPWRPGPGSLRVLDHEDRVTAVSWSPNGAFLATAAADGIVRLWDPSSGMCTAKLPCEIEEATTLAWSTVGNLLAAAGENGGVWVWDLASRTWRTFSDRGPVLAWAPNSTTIASGAATIQLWDAHSGQVTGHLQGGQALAETLAWSPNGVHLASGTSHGTLRIWSVATGTVESIIELGTDSPFRPRASAITGLAWAPRGELLAAVVRDGTLCFFAPGPWEEVARVRLADLFLQSLAWSSDGRHLAVGRNKVIDVLDPARCMQAGSLEHQSDWARASARSPFGTKATSAEVEGSFGGHTSVVAGLAWSPGGRLLASVGADHTARFWDLADANQATPSSAGVRSPPATTVEGRSLGDLLLEDPDRVAQAFPERGPVAVSPDGTRVATDEAVTELSTSRIVTKLSLGEPGVTALAWSHDARRLAIGRDDGQVSLRSPGQDGDEQVICEGWTDRKTQENAGQKYLNPLVGLTPSLTLGGYRVRLFDPDFSPVHAFAWSPDGVRLAAAGLKSGLHVHDLETGTVTRFETEQNLLSMHQVAWSPDGSLLATAEGSLGKFIESPCLVRLWDPAGGNARVVFEGAGPWSALAWAPDGSLLAFAAEDGAVRVWNAAADRSLLLARSRSPVIHLGFDLERASLHALDNGSGTFNRPLAYVWRLRGFEEARLVAELQRIEAVFGKRAVRGGPLVQAIPRSSAPPEPESVPEKGGIGRPSAAKPAPKPRHRPVAPDPPVVAPSPEIVERRNRAKRLSKQAWDRLTADDPARALTLFVEQEPLWRELGDRPPLAQSLAGRALALIELARHEEGLALLREAAEIWRDLGDRDQLRRILVAQGSTYRSLDRHQEAGAAWREEEELCRELDDRKELARNLMDQAFTLAVQNDWSAAREALAGHEAVLRELDHAEGLAEGLLGQIELLLSIGEPDIARQHAEECIALFDSLGRPVEESRARALLLKTRFGRPSFLKGALALLLAFAPAGIGIVLGLRNPWLWIVGAPLVLLTLFMIVNAVSPRLRRALEHAASRL